MKIRFTTTFKDSVGLVQWRFWQIPSNYMSFFSIEQDLQVGTLNSKLLNIKHSFRHKPYTKTNPLCTLSNNVGNQNLSIHVIDYICNTAEHLNTVINTEDFSKYTLNMTPKLNINQEQSEEISNVLKIQI